MRYIDADELLTKLPEDLPYKASVKRVLMQAPTADVVEVVRCKDCLYSKQNTSVVCGYICEHSYGLIGGVAESDFCSYGERIAEE